MYAARQEIAAEIENQALQECSNLQSSSPQRELSDRFSSYSSNHEEFLSISQLQSNSYDVPHAAKYLDVDFSSTSDDTYHLPLQDITSLDNTTKSTMLLSTTLPKSSTPHTFTEEKFSPRNIYFNASDSSDEEFNLKAKFHL